MEITNKLWGLCNTLRHDGVDSSDYVEQLTYLLFLKLAKSYKVQVPKNCKWENYDADIIGLAFEELIGKVANDGKKGAGLYFTPRPLIRAIVEVSKPNPLEKEDFTISDVATGTSGFLMLSHQWQEEINNKKQLSKKQIE